MEFVIENIREARKEKKLSQKDIAGQLGVTQNAYSKLEIGKTKLTLSTLFKIADLLSLDAGYLLIKPKTPRGKVNV